MSTAAIPAASASPRGSSASRLNTRNASRSTARTTASVYLVSSPIPIASPSSGQLPRPSAIRSARSSTTTVVSWSNDTGWKRPLTAITIGEKPTSTAASTCAFVPPPSSRAISAATTITPAPARIANTRSP